jgi:hypothetical protein
MNKEDRFARPLDVAFQTSSDLHLFTIKQLAAIAKTWLISHGG